MRNSICSVLGILALAFLFSCSQVQPDAEAEVQDIEKVMTEQVSAWNEGDIDAYMKGYWQNDSLLFTGGKSITSGWRQATERYRKSYPTQSDMGQLSFEGIQTALTSAQTAVTTGQWLLEKDSNNVSGRFTLVWKKIQNDWRIIVDHSS